MQRYLSWLVRVCLGAVLVVLFLSLASLKPVPAVSAAPEALAESNYAVHFLPSNFPRLCVGDSHSYAFMVKFIEPEEYEPVEYDENGLPLPVPLIGYTARVSATNGTVSPSEFYMGSPYHVFRFTYTAQSEGTEVLQVTIEGGAAGSAAKTLQIAGSCSYNLRFFARERYTEEVGGYEAVFNGRGSFGLNRTIARAATLVGDGSHTVSLGMWADAPGAFSCNMVPLRTGGSFNIDGNLHSAYDFMSVNLDFASVPLPDSMRFDCQALGMGTVTFNFPIGQQTADGNSLNMTGLTFPISGGVDAVTLGSVRVTVVVKQK
jgi:hypothetical protein